MKKFLFLLFISLSPFSYASDLDELYREVTTDEMFVINYSSFRDELVRGRAVSETVDIAVANAAEDVIQSRSESRDSLNQEFASFCSRLDPLRESEDLATELDNITRNALEARRTGIDNALRGRGLSREDIDSLRGVMRGVAGRRISTVEFGLASLPGALDDPSGFKTRLVAGCESMLESYNNNALSLEADSSEIPMFEEDSAK